MSESNYHLEALRKQRVIERKKDAMAKLTKGQHDTCADPGDVQQTKDTILFTGPGDYDYNSGENIREEVALKQENDAKAKSKNLLTNLSKRNVKKKQVPESIRKIKRDQVFNILHPYDFD